MKMPSKIEWIFIAIIVVCVSLITLGIEHLISPTPIVEPKQPDVTKYLSTIDSLKLSNLKLSDKVSLLNKKIDSLDNALIYNHKSLAYELSKVHNLTVNQRKLYIDSVFASEQR